MNPFMTSYGSHPNRVQPVQNSASPMQQVMFVNPILTNNNNMNLVPQFPYASFPHNMPLPGLNNYQQIAYPPLPNLNNQFPIAMVPNLDPRNTHFSNQNGNILTNCTSVPLIPSSLSNLSNFQPLLQNNLLGMPLLNSSIPNVAFSHGHLSTQNAAQNILLNQMQRSTPINPAFLQNFTQFTPSQPMENPKQVPNSQSCVLGSNSQLGLKECKQLGENSCPSQQTDLNHGSNDFQKSQMNGADHFDTSKLKNNHQSFSSQSKHPVGCEKRPQANVRFQSSNKQNQKGNFHHQNKNGRRRNQDGRLGKPFGNLNTNLPEIPRSRTLETEKDIKLWIEQRRKNYPTPKNIEKKAQGRESEAVIAEDAELRRQQLKEILARQAELGVPVAELPPNYLKGPQNKMCEESKEKLKPNSEDISENKFPKRERRRGRKKNRDKKPKCDDISRPRTPTLLQKLLSSEIKRDRGHLTQVFRFMVLNSFFDNWPHKPLEFPLITIQEGLSANRSAQSGNDNFDGEKIINHKINGDHDDFFNKGESEEEEGEITD